MQYLPQVVICNLEELHSCNRCSMNFVNNKFQNFLTYAHIHKYYVVTSAFAVPYIHTISISCTHHSNLFHNSTDIDTGIATVLE